MEVGGVGAGMGSREDPMKAQAEAFGAPDGSRGPQVGRRTLGKFLFRAR